MFPSTQQCVFSTSYYPNLTGGEENIGNQKQFLGYKLRHEPLLMAVVGYLLNLAFIANYGSAPWYQAHVCCSLPLHDCIPAI